jgi:PAS domain S-box-containing protein
MKGNNSKILVVDDNRINLLYIAQILREKEYEIETALSAKEALEVLQKDVFDLILLDIMMPEMSGIEMCTILKKDKKMKDIPIIFVTALDDIQSIEDSFNAGGVDYITKPFHQTELLARVNTHLTLKNLIQQIKSSNVELAHEIIDRVKAEKEVQEQKITIEDKSKQIIESENKYKTMLESMHDGVFICSLNHDLLYVNKAMTGFVGNSPDADRCYDFVYGSKDSFETWLDQVELSDQQLVETFNEGLQVYLQVSVSMVHFQDHQQAYLHIVRNITDQKLAQKRVEEHQKRFQQIYNSSNDAIFICHTNGTIASCNHISPDLLNRKLDDIISQRLLDVLSPVMHDQFENKWATVLNKGTDLFETDMNIGEQLKYLEINAKLVEFNGLEHVLCVCRDVTERKLVQRELLSTVIHTEEKERSRFAKDLHDGIGPLLSTSLLYLSSMKEDDQSHSLNGTIDKVYETVNEAVLTIKEISNNISPRILRNKGLVPAIESFCKKASSAKGIKYHLLAKAEDFKELPENVEISLYRISIELINNTLKYAKADGFNLSIARQDQEIQYSYNDNGIGFNLKEKLGNQLGMGLQNIKSRIESLNGELMFDSNPGEGFSVQIKLKI